MSQPFSQQSPGKLCTDEDKNLNSSVETQKPETQGFSQDNLSSSTKA
jgi:hypothetical protein